MLFQDESKYGGYEKKSRGGEILAPFLSTKWIWAEEPCLTFWQLHIDQDCTPDTPEVVFLVVLGFYISSVHIHRAVVVACTVYYAVLLATPPGLSGVSISSSSYDHHVRLSVKAASSTIGEFRYWTSAIATPPLIRLSPALHRDTKHYISSGAGAQGIIWIIRSLFYSLF